MSQHTADQHTFRVYMEDVDAMGIVYHANYLCFYERARTELLRKKELMLSELMAKNVLFAINELVVQYRYPAKLDDVLTVSTAMKEIKNCSFVFEQQIHNQEQRLISDARIKVVCVNSDLKPQKVPDILIKQ